MMIIILKSLRNQVAYLRTKKYETLWCIKGGLVILFSILREQMYRAAKPIKLRSGEVNSIPKQNELFWTPLAQTGGIFIVIIMHHLYGARQSLSQLLRS